MTEAFPEKQTGGDYALAVAKAATSLIPVAGGLATALLEQMPAPLAKRRALWFNELADKLDQLSKTSIAMEDIKAGGPVLDAILEAVQIATKSGQEEKRKALMSCVVKTVGADSIGQVRLQMVIRRIDQMTEWHLRLLRLINAPRMELERLKRQYHTHSLSSIAGLITNAYPELGGHREIFENVWNELIAMGLVSVCKLWDSMSGEGAFASRTTEMGKSIIEDCFN